MSNLSGKTRRSIASLAILLAGVVLLSACAPPNDPVDEGGTTLPSAQPNFAAPIGFAVGAEPNAIVSADFNADGKLDLAAANGAGNTVSVLLNATVSGAAAPTFRARVPFATGTAPYGLATGDMNGDSKVDLVAANSGAGTVSVLVNTMVSGTAAPTFASQVSFAAGGAVAAIAVGDLNGDGTPDVAVANGNAGMVSVLLNSTVAGGPVTFTAPVSFPAGFGVISLAMGDLNSDGRRDIVAVNLSATAGGAVAVLLNQTANGAAAPSFSSATQFPAVFSPSGLALGDLNGDGKLDVMTFSPALVSGLSVWLNTTSAGSMTPTLVAADRMHAAGYPESIALIDRNSDGTLDIFVASNDSGIGVSVTDNFTAGGATTWSLDGPHGFSAGNLLAEYCTSVMAVGDLNGDGRLDVAVTDFLTNRAVVLVGIPHTL